jgi:Stress responsive A/B Barrel Domain
MLRHAVLVTLKPSVTDTYVSEVQDRVLALCHSIAEVQAVSCGRDLNLTSGSTDLAIVVDFDCVQDFDSYLAHPVHVELGRFLRDGVADRAVVDYEF